jgi:hypothetical protein
MEQKHNYKVGDDVSYAFNGDYYYAGKVARITNKFLTTDQGTKFTLVETPYGYRFRMTGAKCWWMVPGKIEALNPHF